MGYRSVVLFQATSVNVIPLNGITGFSQNGGARHNFYGRVSHL